MVYILSAPALFLQCFGGERSGPIQGIYLVSYSTCESWNTYNQESTHNHDNESFFMGITVSSRLNIEYGNRF